MDYFPLFLDLRELRVLVVGGGSVALRKIALLRKAGASITVVAPALDTELQALVAAGQLNWLDEAFFDTHVHQARLVIAATNDAAVNASVASAARKAGVFVNVVDDLGHSDTLFPAIIDRSPVVVAVGSSGTSPVLTRLIREKIEKLLPESLGPLARLAAEFRARVQAQIAQIGDRRRFWESVLEGPVADKMAANLPSEAAAELERALSQVASQVAAQAADVPKRTGRVILVGAGPGDAGLLTIKGLRAIQQADVVFYDQLVSAEILELVRRDATKIAVGKKGHGDFVAQSAINQLLVEHAQKGLTVVRLKGGDPFIFGRGGEELEVLRAQGIAYEVVPGITAALGCAAYAGIPLTHREHAQAFTLLTAHCRADNDPVQWSLYADAKQTLAIYMGVKELPHISASLISAGRSPETPVAIIENGTRSDQRVLRGNLTTIAELAANNNVQTPALLVIGNVAALSDELHWFGDKPISALQSAIDEQYYVKAA